MPHSDQLIYLTKVHEGIIPQSWLSGDTEYQKAKVIAAVSWHDMKDPSDPPFLACDLSHQEKCIGIVESLMRGNMADSSPFAQAAARRWAEVNQPSTEELAP